MIHYRPKALFQQNSEEREAFAQIATNKLLHRAIAFTQADMAAAGFGPDHMAGVNNFIVALLNLSEPEPTAKVLPVKALESFDNPPVPAPQTPKNRPETQSPV